MSKSWKWSNRAGSLFYCGSKHLRGAAVFWSLGKWHSTTELNIAKTTSLTEKARYKSFPSNELVNPFLYIHLHSRATVDIGIEK